MQVVTFYCRVASRWWCFDIKVLSLKQAEQNAKFNSNVLNFW